MTGGGNCWKTLGSGESVGEGSIPHHSHSVRPFYGGWCLTFDDIRHYSLPLFIIPFFLLPWADGAMHSIAFLGIPSCLSTWEIPMTYTFRYGLENSDGGGDGALGVPHHFSHFPLLFLRQTPFSAFPYLPATQPFQSTGSGSGGVTFHISLGYSEQTPPLPPPQGGISSFLSGKVTVGAVMEIDTTCWNNLCILVCLAACYLNLYIYTWVGCQGVGGTFLFLPGWRDTTTHPTATPPPLPLGAEAATPCARWVGGTPGEGQGCWNPTLNTNGNGNDRNPHSVPYFILTAVAVFSIQMALGRGKRVCGQPLDIHRKCLLILSINYN